MSEIKIFRASAGSGKTYTLTQEFITLLFANPYDYKHILAVTFTNKATAEMKGRVLKTLYALWKHEKPDYLDEFIKIEGSHVKVRAKAKFILHLLLHDYSRFTVSTIDSFFQKVIRSFVQELGLQGGYQIELDGDKILRMAVDRVVMKLGQKDKAELREWLIQYSYDKIDEGTSWNINQELIKLGKEVFSETFQAFPLDLKKKLQTKSILSAYIQQVRKVITDYESVCRQIGQQAIGMMSQHELTWDHFVQKSRTPLKIFEKLQQGKAIESLEKVKELVGQPDLWPQNSQTTAQKSKVLDAYHAGLNSLLEQAILHVDSYQPLANTSAIILENLSALGIIGDIANEISTICREENIFLLADSNRFLNQIIDCNETPFVYEKSGNWYNHFMIDEFQDTSKLQWKNFKPLIDNSLSSSNNSLIVGDVKQSIYRWRNSDWKLLAKQVEIDFQKFGTITSTLDTNWRSSRNIIQFNNQLFETAAQRLQDHFNSETDISKVSGSEVLQQLIIAAYNDVQQKTAPKNSNSGGCIEIQFIENKEDEDKNLLKEQALRLAIEKVDSILANGYRYKDICFLVRHTKDASLITNALLSGLYSSPCPVVSNEALLLSASPGVNVIINQLNYILDSNNQVFEAFLKLYYHELIINSGNESISIDASILTIQMADHLAEQVNQKLYELILMKGYPLMDLTERLIRDLPETTQNEESVFLQALINSVAGFISTDVADLSRFIEWWNSEGKGKSVTVPEDQDAIRVMTIHKSKGLEFEFVIMPFTDWLLEDSRHTNILWCEDPFNELESIPVRYSKRLLNSSFSNYYLSELLHQYVDNLNLLYVAFTRAAKGLFCCAPLPNDRLKTVADLIFLCLQQNHQLSSHFSNDNVYLMGEIPSLGAIRDEKRLNDSTAFNTIAIAPFKMWDYGDRISIHPESEGFTEPSSNGKIGFGKLMHHLFELIITISDVDTAVQTLVYEGLIQESEAPEIQEKVQALLEQNTVKSWFAPGVTILNEATILHQRNTFRPDRVIIENDTVTVIDYKFGDIQAEQHIKQVQTYLQIIKQMGYSKVKGYIWYVSGNSIVPVSLPGQLSLF